MQMIPVAANDVAFSAHAVFVTAVILFQIAIYEVSRLNSYLQCLSLVNFPSFICHTSQLYIGLTLMLIVH